MAVIFFDGFNRAADLAYWTLTGATFSSSFVTPTASNPVTNNIKLSNIGTHSNKKIYFGLRCSTYYVSRTGRQPFVSFYNSSDNSLLELKWNAETVAHPNVGIDVVQNGTTLTTYTVLNTIAGVSYFTNGSESRLFPSSRVLEFELNLTTGAIAINYQGQNLLNSANQIATSFITDNVAGVQIYGDFGGSAYIEDVYLIDDTGTFANTWLGVDFQVHSPSLSGSAGRNSGWTVIPGDSGSFLSEDEGDGSYARAATFPSEIAFNLGNISPSGFNPVVAGLRINSKSRKVTLDSAYKYLYYNQGNDTSHEMGSRIVLTAPNYAPQAAQFVNVNPETSAQWAVSEVNNGLFGLKSVDPS